MTNDSAPTISSWLTASNYQSEGEEEKEEIQEERVIYRTSNDIPNINETPQLHQPETIRIIKPLNGTDDIGIKDFIDNVRYARSQCSNRCLLVELILAEKITGHAERSLRYLRITTYEGLYDVLRSKLNTPMTITFSRH